MDLYSWLAQLVLGDPYYQQPFMTKVLLANSHFTLIDNLTHSFCALIVDNNH